MTEPQIDEDVMQALTDAIADEIGEAYDCTRTWSAWSYGTMRQHDFVPVENRFDEIAAGVAAKIWPIISERAKSADALAKAYTDGQAAMHDVAAEHMDKEVAKRAKSAYPAGVRAGLEMAALQARSCWERSVPRVEVERSIRALIPPADPQSDAIRAVVRALDQLLDDMGDDGQCVCLAAKEMGIAALTLAKEARLAGTEDRG